MSGDTKDKLDLYGVRDDVSSNAVQSCVLKDFLSTLYINSMFKYNPFEYIKRGLELITFSSLKFAER